MVQPEKFIDREIGMDTDMEMEIDKEREREEGGERESVTGKNWFIQLQDLARADDQEG